MIELDIEKCTGCGACVQKCPKKCIAWECKEFGFRYPIVNKEECIDCGLCEDVCPMQKELEDVVEQKVFAVVHKEAEVLKHSTSGGAFSAIAQYVLNKQGTVYGCVMDKELNIVHIKIDSKNDLRKMQGSKYVQSNVNETFSMVEKDLHCGVWVLYSGTPCQIAGLKSYLSTEYDRLITVDIVCHGVGSQEYFNKFIDYIKIRYGSVESVQFRTKEYLGWTCNGTIRINSKKSKPFYNYNNFYYYYFLKGDIYRKSCYVCKYANMVRQGDFTLGDFWGVEACDLPINTSNGCSLLIVNNKRANDILESIQEINKIEVSLEEAVSNNEQLRHPSKLTPIRTVLSEQFDSLDAVKIQKEFMQNNFKEVLIGFIKSRVPYQLKLKLRKRRKRQLS